MLYQLPNGKVVTMTFEDFINLTDEDIQFLMSINAGSHPTGPWHGSSVIRPKFNSKILIDDELDSEEEEYFSTSEGLEPEEYYEGLEIVYISSENAEENEDKDE
jgi:hypothetical protein